MADFRGQGALRAAPAELDRLREFFQRKLPGAGYVVSTTSCIAISDDFQVLWGDLTRTRPNGFQVDYDGTVFPMHNSETMSVQCTIKDAAIVQVVRELVACPTLTDLTLRFPSHSLGVPSAVIRSVFDDLVPQVLVPALRTSRSLSTLDRTLSTLWRNVEAIAGCFYGNFVLRSCTLTVDPCPYFDVYPCRDQCRHTLPTIFGPLMTAEHGANIRLQELVLKYTQSDACGCPVCEDALIDFVARNSTLEKLEVVGGRILRSRYPRVSGRGMGTAVGCNRTLKEISVHCNSADLRDLVRVLVPDSDGHQANTSLSTLVLSLTSSSSVLDCMPDLARLVASNSTLKHVQVSEDWRYSYIDSSNFRAAVVLQSRIRGKLEQMLSDEFRQNTSLQSLSVQWWKLLRVSNIGHDWQMTYEGPCLAPPKTECKSESKAAVTASIPVI